MKIHEYQAKQIFRNFGVPVPNGVACMSVSDADAAIEKMMPDGDGVCVVKAQIHAGGARQGRRGEGGEVGGGGAEVRAGDFWDEFGDAANRGGRADGAAAVD